MAVRRGAAPPGDVVAGLAVWAVLLLLSIGPLQDRIGLLEGLWLLGPLVVVPAGLWLLRPPAGVDLVPAQRLALPAGLLVIVSVMIEPGTASALLVLPWVLVTVVAAWAGARWVAVARSSRAKVVVPVAGLVALLLGALASIAWRGRLHPFGGNDLAMALVSVHLVFAGFGALVVADRTRAAAARRRGRTIAGAAGLALVVAVPVLALGFLTRSPGLGLIGSIGYSAAIVVVAVVMLAGATRRDRSASSTALLVVSGGSLLFALALALGFAVGRWSGSSSVSFARMLELHGTVGGLGFVVGGSLGWSLTDVPEELEG